MNKIFRISLVSVLTLLSIVWSFGFSVAAGEEVKKENKKAMMNEDVKKKIEAILDKHIAERKAPAAILGVWTPDGDAVVVRRKSDPKAGTDAKATDRFRIASVTKTFTATLLLMLADEKKISLDDRLSKFFPEIKNADKITISQILDHTSGIRCYTRADEFDKYVKSEPLKKWKSEELLKILLGAGVEFEPGAGFMYSNSNYLLAGLIVEKVSGNKFADELQKRICGPLGMKNTYYAEGPQVEGSYFHGYDDTLDVSLFDPSGPNFAGAIVSNLDDLKIWIESMSEGKLLSKEMQAQRLKFAGYEKNPESGYGLGIMSWGSFMGHNGAITGYTIVALSSPAAGVTIICMMPMCAANLQGAPEQTFKEIAELIAPEALHTKLKLDKIIKQ